MRRYCQNIAKILLRYCEDIDKLLLWYCWTKYKRVEFFLWLHSALHKNGTCFFYRPFYIKSTNISIYHTPPSLSNCLFSRKLVLGQPPTPTTFLKRCFGHIENESEFWFLYRLKFHFFSVKHITHHITRSFQNASIGCQFVNCWCSFRTMHPVWICYFLEKCSESTLENTERVKVKHLQTVWLCLIRCRKF